MVGGGDVHRTLGENGIVAERLEHVSLERRGLRVIEFIIVVEFPLELIVVKVRRQYFVSHPGYALAHA